MIELLLQTYLFYSINKTAPDINQNLTGFFWPTTNISAWPTKENDNGKIFVPAEATLVVDVNTGKVLLQKNADQKLFIASLTKIMTAVVVFEKQNLNTKVSVPYVATTIAGSKMWLANKELISVRNLVNGLLINSANDAAYALAITTSGDVDSFVEEMNKKAKSLGLKNTHFTNPAGFDNPQNYSTAEDLSLLTRHALKNKVFRNIIKTAKMDFKSASGVPHSLRSTNYFLHKSNGDKKVLGVKTGTTREAGENLITLVENEDGNEILTVLLDAGKRYTETDTLITWIFDSFKWQ